MFRHHRGCASALILTLALGAAAATSRAEEPAATPAPAAQTWDQRLMVFPINDHLIRGGLPQAEDVATLSREKGVKRIVSLIPEDQVPAEVKQAASAAGVAYDFRPIAEGGEGADLHVDRAKVQAVVEELRGEQGMTYLHCRSGRNLNGVVEFTYRLRVDGMSYADALIEVLRHGLQSAERPGLVTDLKLIASGLDALPPVPVMPLADADLLGRDKRVNAGGVRLHVKQMGAGPALYLVHGGPGESHLLFRPYLDALAKDHTLVYFDQRGCGYSERPPFREAYTVERLVADLEALRAALGHEKISLLGQSAGGAVAAHYALAHPDRVDKLVIVSSWASAEEFVRTGNLANALLSADDVEEYRKLIEPIATQRRDPNDEEFSALQKVMYPAQFFGKITPEFRADWSRRSRISSLAVQALSGEFMGSAQVPNRLDLRPQLAAIKAPTLVIAGKYDVVVPVETARTYATGIPGARFEVIDQSGHYPFVEQNEQFIRLVSDFLKPAEPANAEAPQPGN